MNRERLTFAALLLFACGTLAAIAANDTIGVTAGSGKVANLIKFGSNNVISETAICDPLAENICASVGAAGSPSATALTVQAVTLGHGTAANAMRVELPTDGTGLVNAAQSGTWNVTNVSGTVSLPTGASTAAKQPALGTAGTASTDVLTVQGIASMTPLLAAQSGTWNVTNISGTVSLPTGAATSANQTNASQKTQIVDGSGNVIASTSNNLNVQCANCSGSGVSTGDEATFTAGSSLFAGSGGFFQTTATNNALTTGQQGMFQVTANRALFVNLRDAAGTQLAGTAGTAAAPTLSVQGIASMTPLLMNPGTAANWGVVTQGSTTSGQSGELVQCAVTTAAPSYTTAQTSPLSCDTSGNLRVLGTGIAQGSTTSGQTGSLVMGAVTTSSPSYTTAQTSPLSLDTSGNLRVNVVAGGGSGGTSSSFGSAFPGTGTAIGLTNGTNMVAWSAASNYGTSPGAIAVPAVNANVTNTVSITANSSVNVAQINGVTPLMGNGTTGTGSQRVTIASDNTAIAGVGAVATGAAPPTNAIYLGANASGATGGHVAGLISCDSHVFKHITTATDTLAVQGVASQTIRVCGWRSRAAGTATWFLENTASANANCSSTNTQITGVASEVANSGETVLAPFWTGLANTSGNGLCINSTGTGGVDIDIWYTQF